eukprot:TRINITY_DN3156_c0_g1_i1.p1 TRINITY_DN3156_c0_g1~~TRINITY_DN3156_c0_g1_i1.p1  ORF type:complete len:205 (+),score=53.91 TRINITY_DN3156_c0_g1_i1:75-689(+)
MGGLVSKAKGHFLTRTSQRFNIEARTSKILERDKPIPAPKFQADIDFLHKLREAEKESPVNKPLDPAWSERLKKVYVTSEDPGPEVYNLDRHIKTQNPDRPLPARLPPNFRPSKPKKTVPKKLHDGRLTLQEVSDLLSDYRPILPPGLSLQELQEKYNTERNVGDLVNYYRIFQKYSKAESNIPEKSKYTFLPSSDEFAPKKDS